MKSAFASLGVSLRRQPKSACRPLRVEPLERRQLLAVTLSPIGTYETGLFDESGAEVVSYDAVDQRLLVTNDDDKAIDVLDISTDGDPTDSLLMQLPVGGKPTSVDVYHEADSELGLIAVAIKDGTKRGEVEFFRTDGEYLGRVKVGRLPDMLTFTPDGTKVLTADEGEPNDKYSVDPEGTVSIIDVSAILAEGIPDDPGSLLTTAKFNSFNGQRDELRAAGVRIFGPNATVAQDLEPEYVTISSDSATAWVVLQENNAIAELDIATGEFTSITSLGLKDHLIEGNGLDPSNKDGTYFVQAEDENGDPLFDANGDPVWEQEVDDDGNPVVDENGDPVWVTESGPAINIGLWPVKGMYQPDGIANYEVGGTTYLVTANEGDARDYDGFSEETRGKKLDLDPGVFDGWPDLQAAEALGRIKVSDATGDLDGDGDFDEIHAYGARSFSIWTTDGSLIYDSGDDFEQITAAALPENFNSNNDENGSFDGRSDDKGPEPESVVVGQIGENTFAFVSLERVGGVMVYDITDPTAPVFESYFNNRDFGGVAEEGTAGDLAPEGLKFISAEDSPTGMPLLAVANEVSGTTTVYSIGDLDAIVQEASLDWIGEIDASSSKPDSDALAPVAVDLIMTL